MHADRQSLLLLFAVLLAGAPELFAQRSLQNPPGPGQGIGGQGLGPGRGPGGFGASGGTAAAPDYGGGASGQNPLSEFIFQLGFIHKRAGDLSKRRGKEVPGIIPLVEQIRTDTRFLQQKWQEWSQKNRGAPASPLEFDPYFRSLRSMSRELEAAKKLKGGELLPIVQNIARDLRTKAENCKHSQDGLGKQIFVTVHTVRGTNEVGGFEVHYAPMALLKYKREHNRFPRLSSPTLDKNMAPGYYAVWLKRGNSTNAHVAQLIGGAGQTHFAFDITVPENIAAR